MEKNLNTFIDEEDDIDLDELLDLGPEKPYSKTQPKKQSRGEKKNSKKEKRIVQK